MIMNLHKKNHHHNYHKKMKIILLLILLLTYTFFVKHIHGSIQLLTNKECKNIQLDPATQLDIAYQYKNQNPKTKIVMYDNIVKRISSKSKLSITQIKKCIKISKNN